MACAAAIGLNVMIKLRVQDAVTQAAACASLLIMHAHDQLSIYIYHIEAHMHICI
jgi:hypothetical protein